MNFSCKIFLKKIHRQRYNEIWNSHFGDYEDGTWYCVVCRSVLTFQKIPLSQTFTGRVFSETLVNLYQTIQSKFLQVRIFWLYRSDQKVYCELSNWTWSTKWFRFEQPTENNGLNEILTLHYEQVGPFCCGSGQAASDNGPALCCADVWSTYRQVLYILAVSVQYAVQHIYNSRKSCLSQPSDTQFYRGQNKTWQIINRRNT